MLGALFAIAFGVFGVTLAESSARKEGKTIFGPFIPVGPPTRESIDARAFAKAKDMLKKHEGIRRDVYKDSLGFLTVGIGHKVLPEDNLKLGQIISDERVNQFFDKDVKKAFDAARAQATELRKYDADLIAALTSVNFQLGTGWTRTFSNTWNDLKSGSVQTAIKRLYQSTWYKQTPVRVASFVGTLRDVYGAA